MLIALGKKAGQLSQDVPTAYFSCVKKKKEGKDEKRVGIYRKFPVAVSGRYILSLPTFSLHTLWPVR